MKATLVRFTETGKVRSSKKFDVHVAWNDNPPVFEICLPDERGAVRIMRSITIPVREIRMALNGE